jgi:ABC-type phosphate/phosphonate transport system substrate-binding protein
MTVFVLATILVACGSGATAIPPTLPPSATPTLRPTLLPTVGTSVPLGSEARPYQVILVPPKDSSETGTSLAKFLNDRTGLAFKVEIVSSYGDVLAALCGETPTFGWVDGWALLAAQAQGCSTPALKIQSSAASGLRADLVVRTVNKITAVAAFKDRLFCRLSSQDVVSWILPSIMMRGAGFDPSNLKGTLEFPDTATMLQALADGACVAAAIPAGTLTQYQITDRSGPADITKAINVLATSPEIPPGGLMISSNVPADVAETVTKLFVDHQDELKGLVEADQLVKASSSDYADFEKFLLAGGVNLKTLGQ